MFAVLQTINSFPWFRSLLICHLLREFLLDYATPVCLQCGRPGFDRWVGKISWRRAWQPTPVFLPGESPWIEEPGPWGHKESDMTELLSTGHSCTWSLPCHLHPVVPLKKPGCSLKCLDELLHRPPSSAQWNSVPQPVAQPLSPGTQKCQDTCEERKWSF